MSSNTIRQELGRYYGRILDLTRRGFAADPQGFVAELTKRAIDDGVEDTPVDVVRTYQFQMLGMQALILSLEHGQTIVFSQEQASVFMDVTREYTERLDFRLPFQNVYLSLSAPLTVPCWMGDEWRDDQIIGLAISQKEITPDTLSYIEKLGDNPFILNPIAPNLDVGLINECHVVYEDRETTHFAWMSNSEHELVVDQFGPVYESWSNFKRLAIACIGYINCENIYLEKQGEVPEAVNRKREAKGKSRLEPYYVCRIKGVQYDNHATGEGSKHGIRYDVRGHFRRLETGKTIWVRPHQRGLTNELYVPKVYQVSKGAKPKATT